MPKKKKIPGKKKLDFDKKKRSDFMASFSGGKSDSLNSKLKSMLRKAIGNKKK